MVTPSASAVSPFLEWPETYAVSPDHLVGAGKDEGRDGHAQRLGRLEIHHHHELLDALRGHLRGPPALEDLVHEVRGASPHLEGVHLVTDEPARLGKRAVPDGGQALTHGELGDAPREGVEYRVRLDGHGLHPAPPHSREGALQPFGGARLEALYVHLHGLGGEIGGLPHDLRLAVLRIQEETKLSDAGHGVLEDLETMGACLQAEERGARDVAPGTGHARDETSPHRVEGGEDSGLELRELVGQIGGPRRAPLGPAILEDDGLPLDVAEVAEATAEGVEPARRVLRGAEAEEGDAGSLRRLRARQSGSGEDPRAQNGEQVTASNHERLHGRWCRAMKISRYRRAGTRASS